MKKLLVAAALSAALVLALAGCGGGGNDTYLEDTVGILGADPLSGASNVVYYNDINSALLGLGRGDISVLPLPGATAAYVSAQSPELYTLRPAAEGTREIRLNYAMAVPEGERALLDKLNAAIDGLAADGTLKKLAETYLGEETPTDMVPLPEYPGAETYRVVLTGDLPPMDYLTPEGVAAGYNVALLSAISDYLQVNFQPVVSDAGSRSLLVSSGKADILFWVQGISLGDAEEADFSADLPQGLIAGHAYQKEVQTDVIAVTAQ